MSNGNEAPKIEAKMTDEELQAKVQEILEDKQLSQVDKVRELHKLGFNRKQLHEVFNFPTSTVYYALPAKPEKGEGDNDDDTALTDHRFPITIKGSDVIMPESIIDHYLADGSTQDIEPYGRYLCWRGHKLHASNGRVRPHQTKRLIVWSGWRMAATQRQAGFHLGGLIHSQPVIQHDSQMLGLSAVGTVDNRLPGVRVARSKFHR